MSLKRFSLSFAGLLCTAVLVSCMGTEDITNSSLVPPVADEQISEQTSSSIEAVDEEYLRVEREAEYYTKDWGKAFGNVRYNFFITIPQEWQAFDRSDNGDGYFIECGNPDIDMRVFGAYYFPEIEEINQLAGEPFLFDSGVQGFVDASDGVLLCSYLSEAENSVISFYIDYSNDPAWFSENEETVMLTAKSLRDGQRREF